MSVNAIFSLSKSSVLLIPDFMKVFDLLVSYKESNAGVKIVVLKNLKIGISRCNSIFYFPFDTQRVNFIEASTLKKAIIKIIIFEAQKDLSVLSLINNNGGSQF
jgi:hypothetical protein